MQVSQAMSIDEPNYLVIGAGVSGLSVAKFLAAHNKNFRLMDSRDLPPNASEIKTLLPKDRICFGAFDQHWMQEADEIILSPGVALQTPELQQVIAKGVKVYGDVELFAQMATKPYIAITGSNGKSTVTMLVASILNSQGLNAKAGANIGEPALNLLNDESVDIYVLELSSFQLETCSSLRPQVAVVLNVSDDHLDRHQSLEEYAKIKASIYNNAKSKITYRQCQHLSPLNDAISFGENEPEINHYGVKDDGQDRWLMHGEEKLIQVSQLPLLGVTGELNVLAALALTEPYINDKEKALQAIADFKGLPHRCELVAEHQDVRWIDDSKGTNIGATASAISGLDGSVILFLGGVHKGGELESLKKAAAERVKLVIAFGQDKEIFTQGLNDICKIIEVDSLNEAVKLAHANALAGDTVLFSPACASFDMYSNYIERGLAFQKAVKSYALEAEDG